MAEITVDELVQVLPWRCFHCDFVTSDPAEAEAHFGERDDAEEFKPLCKWWRSMEDSERAQEYQELRRDFLLKQRENMRLRTQIEGLEYQVGNERRNIQAYRPFRQLASMHEVFGAFDTMEGRALAGEANAGELSKALQRALDFLLAGEEGEHTPQTRELEEVLKQYRTGRLSDRAAAKVA